MEEDFCQTSVNASVEINPDSYAAANRIPGGCNLGHNPVDCRGRFNPFERVIHAVHLDRCVPLFHPSFGGHGDICWSFAVDPGVHPHFVTYRPAEELVNRDAQCLALDVPEGLLDSRYRGHFDGPAAVKATSVEDLEEVFDVTGIVSDDKVAHFLDTRGDGCGFAFDDGFAPTRVAAFGGDFAEEPAGGYLEELNSFDFHMSAFDGDALSEHPLSLQW